MVCPILCTALHCTALPLLLDYGFASTRTIHELMWRQLCSQRLPHDAAVRWLSCLRVPQTTISHLVARCPETRTSDSAQQLGMR